ncbi:hypothetical protein HYU89_00870 [Candidatus Collierbacteria bacterium]|nr:hypothetical protein [Candidatus Collierbacteria bacterium]
MKRRIADHFCCQPKTPPRASVEVLGVTPLKSGVFNEETMNRKINLTILNPGRNITALVKGINRFSDERKIINDKNHGQIFNGRTSRIY